MTVQTGDHDQPGDAELVRRIEDLHQQIAWLIGERVSRIDGDDFRRSIMAAKWELLQYPRHMRP